MKDSYAGSGNFKGVSWNIVFCKYHSNGFGGVEPAAGSGLLRWGGEGRGVHNRDQGPQTVKAGGRV